jgi:hypothetical protein
MTSNVGRRLQNGNLEIEQSCSCHYRTDFERNKVLDIYCSIEKNFTSSGLLFWQISGHFDLTTTDTHHKINKITEEFTPFKIACGHVKWMGFYDEIFIKSGISCNLANPDKGLLPDIVSPYSSEPLLEFQGETDHINVSSPYDRLKEVPVKI